ncbi:GPI-GlcNAc transferase complex, PIG-H component-domain-containing protein [Myxozyma melibiosi]|uniref:GPI-GlcNAc transferase complex, PIG-H component-domain-containing protein n=1 Tax=Myxozyma melibiosi TaxID=54550 RepID=A0ABR1F0J8_9ASCO
MPPTASVVTTEGGLTVTRDAPAPTTVSYTITNQTRGRSAGALLVRAYRLACLVFFLGACAHSLSRFRSAVVGLPFGVTVQVYDRVQVTVASSTYSFPNYLLVILAICLFCSSYIYRGYAQDSILVMHDFGIELKSAGAMRFSSSSQFIPIELIQDIVINEGFRGFEVIYYLAVIVKGRGRLLVIFPNTLPKRNEVEYIWRDIRRCMYQTRVSMSVDKDVYAKYEVTY